MPAPTSFWEPDIVRSREDYKKMIFRKEWKKKKDGDSKALDQGDH